jgi:hypothetical protein
MFDENLYKVGIFTGIRKGWDTYNFDPKTKEMVKFYKKTG